MYCSVVDLPQTVMALLNSAVVDIMDVLIAMQHPQFSKLSPGSFIIVLVYTY